MNEAVLNFFLRTCQLSLLHCCICCFACKASAPSVAQARSVPSCDETGTFIIVQYWYVLMCLAAHSESAERETMNLQAKSQAVICAFNKSAPCASPKKENIDARPE